MEDPTLIAGLTLAVIAFAMLAENARSRWNERALRARGATEPDGDVYRLMQLAYPACFIAMAIEGGVFGIARPSWWYIGVVTILGAKTLKYWAIASLGPRWTFRVLVPPGEPLVTRGPYRWLAHPNYLAVFGELIGMALMMSASITGVLSVAAFGALIAQRVAVETRALGRAERYNQLQ